VSGHCLVLVLALILTDFYVLASFNILAFMAVTKTK